MYLYDFLHQVGKQSFQTIDDLQSDRKHNNLAISVDNNSGIVKTMNKLERAHVFISSTEDFDIVQTLVVPIEVSLLYLFEYLLFKIY